MAARCFDDDVVIAVETLEAVDVSAAETDVCWCTAGTASFGLACTAGFWICGAAGKGLGLGDGLRSFGSFPAVICSCDDLL